MSIITFGLLELGGFLYFPLTYWMVSSPLIFGNKVSPISYQRDIIRAEHPVFSSELENYSIDPPTLILIAWLLVLVLWFVRKTYLVGHKLI